jgi:transcriptional regulator with XRE-family HTH domain
MTREELNHIDGSLIRGLRKTLGLKLADMSRSLGLSPSYWSRFERGLSLDSTQLPHLERYFNRVLRRQGCTYKIFLRKR